MIKFMFIISDMFWSTRWSRCPGPACQTRKTTEKYARQAGAFQPTHAQCAPRQKCNLAVVEKWCPLLPVFTHCQSHVLLFKDWLYDVRLKFASVKVTVCYLPSFRKQAFCDFHLLNILYTLYVCLWMPVVRFKAVLLQCCGFASFCQIRIYSQEVFSVLTISFGSGSADP